MQTFDSVLIKSTLGQSTARILRDRIMRGEYEQGSKIVEEDIAEEFSISRSCVRDALLLLEMEGLIVREINKRKTVRKFTRKNIEELLRARIAIETPAAIECASNNTIPESELKHNIDLMQKFSALNSSDDRDGLIMADLAFHDEIIFASKNTYYEKFWSDVRSQCLMLMNRAFSVSSEGFISGISRHDEYIHVLIEGNPLKIAELVEFQCLETREFLFQGVDD